MIMRQYMIAGFLLAAALAGCGGNRTYYALLGEVADVVITSPENEIEVESFSKDRLHYTTGRVSVNGEEKYYQLEIYNLYNFESLPADGVPIPVRISYDEYTSAEGAGNGFGHDVHFQADNIPLEINIDESGNVGIDIALENEVESADVLEADLTREVRISWTNVRIEERVEHIDS